MSDNNLQIKKQIDAYVKGALNEDEIIELWAEIAKNPVLLDDLELEIGVRKIIKEKIQTRKEQPVSGLYRLPSWTWHAAAAAVIIIVAGIQLFQVENKTSLEQFVLEEISPNNYETSDGIRSKEMVLFKADSLINLGLSAILSGNEPQALSLYNEVIDNYSTEPYLSKAFLNKGILLYNQGNYEGAVLSYRNALDQVDGSRMITEKAYWYMGNALVKLGELDEARLAVYQAYSLDGVYRKPAFLLLQKLNYDLGNSDFKVPDNLEENQPGPD